MSKYKETIRVPPMTIPPADLTSSAEGNWQVFENEKSILGQIGETHWYGVFTLAQAVNDPGVHFVLAPRENEYCPITKISTEDLAIGTEFVRQFLLTRDIAIAGINTSEDTPDRRPVPQRWPNLHIHLIEHPNLLSLEKTPAPSPRNREPFLLDDILSEIFNQDLSINGIIPINKARAVELVGSTADSIRGASLFSVDLAKVEGPDLAHSFKLLNQRYRALHAQVFGAIASNYHQVVESKWTQPYSLRGDDDVSKRVSNLGLTDQCRKNLLRLVEQLRPDEEVDKSLRTYRSPAYSIFLFTNHGSTIMAFHPHIFRQSGVIDQLVEIEKKTDPTADLGSRKQRARAVFNETLINQLSSPHQKNSPAYR